MGSDPGGQHPSKSTLVPKTHGATTIQCSEAESGLQIEGSDRPEWQPHAATREVARPGYPLRVERCRSGDRRSQGHAAHLRGPGLPPAADSHQGPDTFHQPERPRALQESVSRAENARSGKSQDVMPAPVLKGVENQHGSHSEEAKCRKRIHREGQSFTDAPSARPSAGIAANRDGGTRKNTRSRQM